jgi:hypothetical protein
MLEMNNNNTPIADVLIESIKLLNQQANDIMGNSDIPLEERLKLFNELGIDANYIDETHWFIKWAINEQKLRSLNRYEELNFIEYLDDYYLDNLAISKIIKTMEGTKMIVKVIPKDRSNVSDKVFERLRRIWINKILKHGVKSCKFDW